VSFDLSVEDDGATRRVTVSNLTGPLNIDAVVSLDRPITGVSVNGSPVAPTIDRRFARYRVLLPGLTADAGTDLTIDVGALLAAP